MKRGILFLPILLVPLSMVVAACGQVRSASGDEVAAAEAAGLERVELQSPDIFCTGCVATIKATLEDVGMTAVSADLERKTMTGYYDPSRLEPDEIRKAVENVGYRVERLQTGDAPEN